MGSMRSAKARAGSIDSLYSAQGGVDSNSSPDDETTGATELRIVEKAAGQEEESDQTALSGNGKEWGASVGHYPALDTSDVSD